MLQIFCAWCVFSSSISYFLPWISMTSNNLNIFPEFPIRILCVDATKLSRIDYNGNNNLANDQFIIRAEENTQMGRQGKHLNHLISILSCLKYRYIVNAFWTTMRILAVFLKTITGTSYTFRGHIHNAHQFYTYVRTC